MQSKEYKAVGDGPERRFYQFEHRADKSADGRNVIAGSAAMLDEYAYMGYYIEVIRAGAFDDMKTDRCACLKNHETSLLLGRTSNQTLELVVTSNGLDYRSTLPNTTTANDTYTEIEGGYITHSSFAFTVKEAVWREMDRSLLAGLISEEYLDRLSYGGKVDVREIVKIDELFDVSPVTYPAYQGTSVNTDVARRSFDAWKQEAKREPETRTEPGWTAFFEATAANI